MEGFIHSYDTFGTLDGPGIRFVVFMQGCFLKCKYCHNRDTWKFNIGNKYTPEELVTIILKYKTYFDFSNGGVTFSGGEPLAQQDFLLETIKLLKKYNINVAIDTSGCFYLSDKIKEIIDLADLFLLDIKHIDNQKCLDLCGVNNNLELDFARYLSDINKDIWIRQVLVPGYTDAKEDLLKLKEFLKTLKSIRNIEILPYQNFGVNKWYELGLKYPLEGVRIARTEDVEIAKKILDIDSLISKKI